MELIPYTDVLLHSKSAVGIYEKQDQQKYTFTSRITYCAMQA